MILNHGDIHAVNICQTFNAKAIQDASSVMVIDESIMHLQAAILKPEISGRNSPE